MKSPCCRVVDDKGEDHYWQPVAHHIFWFVVAALDYDVWLDSLDQLERGILVKDQNLIHTAQRKQDCQSVVFAIEWSPITL